MQFLDAEGNPDCEHVEHRHDCGCVTCWRCDAWLSAPWSRETDENNTGTS